MAIVYVCDHQVRPPSRQLYVENHRAHEVMLHGNSGTIIGASIWLAIAADHLVGHLANMHGKRPTVTFSSAFHVYQPNVQACAVGVM